MVDEENEFNATKTLIDIKTDIARISTKIDGLNELTNKTEKALELANENKKEIERITKIQNWIIATIVTGVGAPIIVTIIKGLLS